MDLGAIALPLHNRHLFLAQPVQPVHDLIDKLVGDRQWLSVSPSDYLPVNLSKRHRETLKAVFARPTRSSIVFNETVALVRALGGEVAEREGSRVSFELNDEILILHRPHPQKELKKYAVEYLRDFLIKAGETP